MMAPSLPFLGEIAALATACCWVISSLSFQTAGRKVGSLPVNLIRIVLGFLFLSVYLTVVRGTPVPLDATPHAWGWLTLSGVAGFLFGDLFLFKSFVVVGARTAMLVMSSVPVLTTVIAYLFMGETIGPIGMIGMAVTIAGIALVVAKRDPAESAARPQWGRGVLYAFGGAFGQAVGLVLSKYGMGAMDPFAATQIRVITGVLGFVALVTYLGAWGRVAAALRDRRSLAFIATGAFFGPFLGVSLSLLSVQYTATGIASTIMSTTPVLIIAPAIVLFKEKVSWREVMGAAVAVGGVALLFWR
ncbi:MAG TPA: DMT family transporter [bacterium]|nr:DMT family transporter [bacterium]